MAVGDPTPNQANYQDAQSFKIDIDKIFSDFMQAIDKVRSYSVTTAITDSQVASALGGSVATMSDARSALSKMTTLAVTPQESRCHAFYRIIGFPVSDAHNKIYNPGHDIIFDKSRKQNDTAKIAIIRNSIDKFRDLSIARESFVSTNQVIFADSTSIDAGTLALSSGVNIRPFITPLNDTDGFNTDPTAQQYTINYANQVGTQTKNLTEYQNTLGLTPTKLPSTRTHLIRPFLVDPVIDITVNDGSKSVGIPFVPDKSFLQVKDGSGKYVNRPLIEQIIRDRFTIENTADTTGTADQSVLDYIKSIPSVVDQDIINKAATSFKLTDQTQFVKFFNIARAMIKKLVQAQGDIQTAQTNYYWVPVPSSIGPEGGCKVQGVFFSDKMDPNFVTVKDQAIIMAKIQVAISDVSTLANNSTGTPDVGGFAFDAFKTTFGPDTSTALGDNSRDTLKKLTSTRNAILTKANNALRTVEIITGEFSGLGLCDIIAILAGLYLMPQADLLGFLDDDSITRMTAAGLSGSASSLTTATSSLISVVQGFYNIMDAIYLDASQNNGQTPA